MQYALALYKHAYYIRRMTDTLGFLISDVSRLMRRAFDDRARRNNVTRAQWKALGVLKRHEGLNQGALADLLEVEPITLCRMIDRLEQAGLVERRRDPADRRAWRIFLTPRAVPLLDQLRDLANDMMEQALAGLDAEEQDRLRIALERIRDNLGQPEHDESERAHG